MPEVFSHGPASYTVNVAVTAGQLVTVLGVARDSGAPAGSGATTDFGTLRPEIAVYSAPYEVKVTFAADTLFGQKVVAAASGQVTPVGAAAVGDATQVVGYCTEPAGVLATGVGRIKLV
jgi:hypothetical protein